MADGRKRRSRLVFAVLALVVLVSVGVLIATPPMIMRPMLYPVTFSRVYSPEEFGLTAKQVTLSTEDGWNLIAHRVDAPNPRAVVIFLSGIHNPSVTAFFGHAGMLKQQNYSSLLVEMRAHGDSEGDRIALGFEEYRDVAAAVAHLQSLSQYDHVPIAVFGLSMGGAVAINAIGQLPEIDALISLSAYSSWEEEFTDQMVAMGFPSFYAAMQRPFVRLYLALSYGRGSTSLSPRQQIANLGDRPALLIHSQDDSQVTFASFQRLLAAAPDHVETWVRVGDRHFIVDGDFLEPQQDHDYAQRIIGFLHRNFPQDPAANQGTHPK